MKKLASSNDSNKIMKKLVAYSANITGSQPYWYQRRIELESTFEQKKPATFFFTFSFADHHWPDLHRLLPGRSESEADKFRNVLNNPHLVDWYFSHRLDTFMKIYFDEHLKCDWRWHRYFILILDFL